jgi:hypothetical protein
MTNTTIIVSVIVIGLFLVVIPTKANAFLGFGEDQEQYYKKQEKYYIDNNCDPRTQDSSGHVKIWRCSSGTLSFEDSRKPAETHGIIQ